MALWLIRAGRKGEDEDFALQHGVAVIGWGELPDLTSIESREELDRLCRDTYPEETRHAYANMVGQIWTFRARIHIGDLIVLPLKRRGTIAVGKVVGPYTYQPDYYQDVRHTHPVEWVRTDIARDAIDK